MATSAEPQPIEDQEPYLAERVVGLGEPTYTAPEVEQQVGLSPDVTRRVWRAIGFIQPADDEKAFTEADVDALRTLKWFLEAGLADLDLVLGMTRIISQSAARVADAEADAIKEELARGPHLADVVLADAERTDGAARPFAALEHFLVHLWKRHLVASLGRVDVLNPGEAHHELAIGFADIVGYTRLSRHIGEAELSRFVESFETAAQDIAVDHGARIVKTIGDEVMFVADDPDAAADTALDLIACDPGDGQTGVELRVGLAHGFLLSHRGDYLGPTVNLANRAAQAAYPNTILVSEEMKESLDRRDDLEVKPIPRRKLKGIGPVDLWVLRRKERRS